MTILRRLKHQNITTLYEVYEDKSKIYLIFEYVPGGDLFERLSKKGVFSESKVAQIFKQILEVLVYLQERDILHGDIKVDNILLLGEGKQDVAIKVADFGLAKDFKFTKHKITSGTPGYAAPEILKRCVKDYSKIDMFSLGVVVYIL